MMLYPTDLLDTYRMLADDFEAQGLLDKKLLDREYYEDGESGTTTVPVGVLNLTDCMVYVYEDNLVVVAGIDARAAYDTEQYLDYTYPELEVWLS